jgi:serine/threonine protein kinase
MTLLFNPGDRVSKYQILRFIGGGQFGQVYHCRDDGLAAEKALKFVKVSDPASLRELLEAQVAHKCRHDHCVSVNEVNIYVVNNDPYVAIDMEYIDGSSVEDLIKTNALSIHDVVRLMRGALFGLEHAHNQSVLHKDIKPANIMVSRQGVPKISDFGLAEFAGSPLVGVPAGYTSHLAPEFFSSNITTVQTDVFAAGMTFFRMVNFINDWDGTLRVLTNLNSHIQSGRLVERIGFQRWVPDQLKRICRRATHSDIAKRYESIGSFRQDLDRLRFNIDWRKSAPDNWIGHSGQRSHEIVLTSVAGGTSVEHLVNGRRRTTDCSRHALTKDAVEAVNSLVSKTSFA